MNILNISAGDGCFVDISPRRVICKHLLFSGVTYEWEIADTPWRLVPLYLATNMSPGAPLDITQFSVTSADSEKIMW